MSSYKVKGILSFPVLTLTALENKRKRNRKAKFSAMLLIPPNDPQVSTLQGIIETEKANGWPNGAPRKMKVCFDLYENKIDPEASYYDPRFEGYYCLTTTAPVDKKPEVVDTNLQPITDPGEIIAGAVVWLNLGITKYSQEGNEGIGGWLNGVVITKEEMPFGRLDGKPSVDQMFSGVDLVAGSVAPATPAAAPSPAPVPPAAPVPPPVPAQPQMTSLAGGATYESFVQQGWNDDQMRAAGYLV